MTPVRIDALLCAEGRASAGGSGWTPTGMWGLVRCTWRSGGLGGAGLGSRTPARTIEDGRPPRRCRAVATSVEHAKFSDTDIYLSLARVRFGRCADGWATHAGRRARNKSILRQHLLPTVEALRLGTIEPGDLQALRTARTAEGALARSGGSTLSPELGLTRFAGHPDYAA
jgi:hypothetical protein